MLYLRWSWPRPGQAPGPGSCSALIGVVARAITSARDEHVEQLQQKGQHRNAPSIRGEPPVKSPAAGPAELRQAMLRTEFSTAAPLGFAGFQNAQRLHEGVFRLHARSLLAGAGPKACAQWSGMETVFSRSGGVPDAEASLAKGGYAASSPSKSPVSTSRLRRKKSAREAFVRCL